MERMTMNRERLELAGAVILLAVAMLSAYDMVGRIRLVDIITLFFSGFGGGVGLTHALVSWRSKRPKTPGRS
jgi:hypothetical protein